MQQGQLLWVHHTNMVSVNITAVSIKTHKMLKGALFNRVQSVGGVDPIFKRQTENGSYIWQGTDENNEEEKKNKREKILGTKT